MKYEASDLDQPIDEGGSAPSFKLILLLLVTIALAIFFFQNVDDDAPVDFLWMSGDWPVFVVIGISVILGVVLDRLATWQWRRARRKRAEQG